ncbi:MAG: MDR family MFS transporter [Pseudolabrys sp.]
MSRKPSAKSHKSRSSHERHEAGTGHKAEPHYAPALSHPEVRTIVLGIMLAMFLGALDQTIVATALPTIGRHFGDLGDLSWVVTAYLLTSTAVTPLYGKLSDIHGRRCMMLIAISLFVAGSLTCALAPSMTALVFSRGLQGMGGGGLMALAQTIIADIVSPRERGRYQGYIAAVFAASSIGGPVLGGFLTQHVDWSLIFWINLPLGFAAFGMTSIVLRRVPYHPRKHKIDVAGAVLMMLAAVALLLALSWGGRKFDWVSLEIAALLVTSGALWGLFAWRLRRAEEPFLPLAVLGNPVVRTAALAGACTMATLVGMTIMVPLYFEVVLHMNASQSGMALIPQMTATVVFSTVSGRLMMHLTHYKRVGLIGTACAMLALLTLAVWPTSLSTVSVLALLAVVGSGLGTVFPISTVCMQNAVTQHQAHAASAETLREAFRYVFLACALVSGFTMAFLIAMEERTLRGPVRHSPEAGAPTAPATPIPAE